MDRRKLLPGKPSNSMAAPQQKLYRRVLILIIAFGFFTILVFLYGSRAKSRHLMGLDRLLLSIKNGQLIIYKNPASGFIAGEEALRGVLGTNQWGPGIEGGWSKPWSDCYIDRTNTRQQKLTCPGRAQLTIERPELQDDRRKDNNCYQLTWTSLSPGFIPSDCFSTKDQHWYGGAELLNDRWTIEKSDVTMQHFLSNDVGMVREGYGGVLERYWLTSHGISLTVDDHVPLHVGIENGSICFQAKYANSSYQNPANILPVLNYTICSFRNVLDAHLRMAARIFKPSRVPPHKSLFFKPIWSTWAKYRTNITQRNVLQYASLITDNGFNGCQIEIDDGYTRYYGDSTFDPLKFPNPLEMSNKLKSLGFRVTTWLTPFTNNDSANYAEGLTKGYFIKPRDSPRSTSTEHLVKWWRGLTGVVDLTNPDAVLWMKRRIENFKSQGVEAFKFDAGECNFIPRNSAMSLVNLNHYGRLYATLMHNFTNNRMIEVRVGYKSQHLPVMVRMMDKDSSWGYHRGLQTLIPTALLFGILGYPYVLPDMVGGNGYAGEVQTLPDKELYLRWLAATILLPFVQFSIPPWDYDGETVKMAKDLLEVRQAYMKDITDAAKASSWTALPMIRPLWWTDPENPQTFDIDSQFILGNDLLVAPVLHQGRKERDIYLPQGHWKDMKTKKVYTGRQLLRDYLVPLNQLPVFRRENYEE